MKRITMILLTVLMVLVLCRGSSQRRYLPLLKGYDFTREKYFTFPVTLVIMYKRTVAIVRSLSNVAVLLCVMMLLAKPFLFCLAADIQKSMADKYRVRRIIR